MRFPLDGELSANVARGFAIAAGHDHYFVLNQRPGDSMMFAARACDPRTTAAIWRDNGVSSHLRQGRR
jgi:hypothetical protein